MGTFSFKKIMLPVALRNSVKLNASRVGAVRLRTYIHPQHVTFQEDDYDSEEDFLRALTIISPGYSATNELAEEKRNPHGLSQTALDNLVIMKNQIEQEKQNTI